MLAELTRWADGGGEPDLFETESKGELGARLVSSEQLHLVRSLHRLLGLLPHRGFFPLLLQELQLPEPFLLPLLLLQSFSPLGFLNLPAVLLENLVQLLPLRLSLLLVV